MTGNSAPNDRYPKHGKENKFIFTKYGDLKLHENERFFLFFFRITDSSMFFRYRFMRKYG